MSKSTIKIIDKFKIAEKQHQELSKIKVIHQYVLYTYDNGDEKIIFDDLLSCLEKIPTKMNIIEDYQYADKCYIVELLSYYLDKDKNHTDIGNFKLKFG
jgi:hypothetical protein